MFTRGVAEPSTGYRALRAVVVVWSCEIVVARVSSDPQTLRDMLVSGIGLASLGLLPLPLVRLASLSERAKRLLMALVTIAPVSLVTLGIAGPPAWQRGSSSAARRAAASARVAGC